MSRSDGVLCGQRLRRSGPRRVCWHNALAGWFVSPLDPRLWTRSCEQHAKALRRAGWIHIYEPAGALVSGAS